MSSGGQIVGGIVGGAIGAVVGGPTGAIYGAQIGIMAGGLLDPPKGPTVEGPRLNDLSVQTSTYGQFIPRTYGTIGMPGNVFWLENNKIKEVVKKKKSGGKGGGGGSTIKTFTYYATFAVGLCEGPIAGVRRIWVGPDLVYDAGSSDLETIIASNQAAQGFSVYLGTDTQQPDPRMQAEMGVANCPAYRGLAYIVVKDLLLTDYGNSVAGAQVKVEVVNNLSSSDIVSSSLMPNTASWAGIAYSLGNYCAIAPGNFSAVSQDNGASWGQYQMPINQAWSLLASSGNFMLAATASGGAAATSRDGRSWTQVSTPASASGYSLLHHDGVQFILSDWYSYVTSIDGASWTAAKPTTSDSQWRAGATSGNRTVIISSSGPGSGIPRAMIIDRGNDPVEIVMADVGAIWWDISHDGSRYIIVGSDSATSASGHFATSVDGESWVYGRLPIITARSVSSALGSSVAMGYYLGSVVACAFDGVSWRAVPVLSDCLAIASSTNGAWITAVGLTTQNALTFKLDVPAYSDASLKNIFISECKKASLINDGDIDAVGLADSVTGFKVTATGSIRNAIEPLRGAWPFDVVQSGYKIKARSRGTASVVTVPYGDLAIDTQLTESREMDSQLPQNITVKYIDRDRDYDANEQRAQRDNTEAVNSLLLDLPVVLSATQGAQVADKLIRIYALEKSDFAFTLPAPYRYLEPGDVVTISTPSADFSLRLASINYTADGRLECAGRPSSASTYASIAPGDGGQTGDATIPLAGATVGLIIDCPVIDEGLQDAPGFAAGMNGYSAGWPGGILYRTADGGQTWDDLQAITGRSTAGFAAGVLSASAGNLIQRGGSLTVSLISGELESVTEAQMLNGANIAAYGVNGRWEIIRFQNATLNANGSYTLDTFWRGDKGTEWATGLHASNDYFVLMTDPDLAFVGMPTDSIGQPRDYRSVTAGADIDSAASVSFTYDATNLETLSGVHPKGSRSAGDLTVTWQRRTRVGGAWRDYVDASLGEATQAYDVDVMDGSTVKRTISAVTPTVLYTDAMQVADFGSTQSSVTVNIYQLSAVVGRGYKLEATL